MPLRTSEFRRNFSGEATSAEDFDPQVPEHLLGVGHIADNPAYGTALGDQYYGDPRV